MLGTDTALNEISGDAEGETSSCATKMRDVERRGLSSHSGKGMFNDAYLIWSGTYCQHAAHPGISQSRYPS